MARVHKDGEFVNCKVSTETVRRLEEYMQKSRLSKTAIVEMALEEYLERVMPEYVEPKSEENR